MGTGTLDLHADAMASTVSTPPLLHLNALRPTWEKRVETPGELTTIIRGENATARPNFAARISTRNAAPEAGSLSLRMGDISPPPA